MARQRCGAKTIARLCRETGLPIAAAWVRGGTEHRYDLGLVDGRVMNYQRGAHGYLEEDYESRFDGQAIIWVVNPLRAEVAQGKGE